LVAYVGLGMKVTSLKIASSIPETVFVAATHCHEFGVTPCTMPSPTNAQVPPPEKLTPKPSDWQALLEAVALNADAKDLTVRPPSFSPRDPFDGLEL
jgi:hypothetical protein